MSDQPRRHPAAVFSELHLIQLLRHLPHAMLGILRPMRKVALAR
jgi:hypothetical protein